jgi:predicted metal-dependent phosphotriesterase family hydrolase
MTPQEEIIRGDEAERLLANPLLKTAFADCRAGIVAAMTGSAMGDQQTHNRLVIALQLLTQIEKSIATHVQTGRMAQVQVADKSYLRQVVGL